MKEFKSIVTNYKTSIPAIIVITAGVLYAMKKIDQDQANWIVITMVGALGLGAKDHTK